MKLVSYFSSVEEGLKALACGKKKLAIRKLTLAINLDPRSFSGHFNLALAYLGVGDYEKAEIHARRTLRLHPTGKNVNLNLGVIKRSQGDESSALRYYNRELKLHPTCYEAHYNIGVIKAGRREWRQALEHLEACWLNGHKGDDLEEDIYRWVLERDPRNVWALNNLAVCLNKKGEHAEALCLLEEALSICPSNAIAKENLKGTIKRMQQSTGSKELGRGSQNRRRKVQTARKLLTDKRFGG